jgi:TonB-linked SusC/RagA family outer membrane protein
LNPAYDPANLFKTSDMVQALKEGKSTDWFDILTNDAPFIAKHNLSISHGNEKVSSFMSIGYSQQEGYHIGEDYNRWNARLNLDNYINDWFTLGIQTFFTHSDFSGLDINRDLRYLSPYALAWNEDGTLRRQPGGLSTNPLFDVEESDHEDFRINLFVNVYANIDIPFIKGLSYKVNYTTNYRNETENIYRPHGSNFQGLASKESIIRRSYSSDNILSYENTFAEHHNVGATVLYGFERRKFSGTFSQASNFVDGSLGFNRLEAGQPDLYQVSSDAEEESSLYSMGRLTYNYDGKYFFTGTVRRDGFSGFGENNKFGVFPSAAIAWAPTAEKFLAGSSWLNHLKIRGSYGVSGNRTIERYQIYARVGSGYSYVDAEGLPLYSQSINTLGNNDLQWETITGYNFGLDFGLFRSRISGSIDYYTNRTENLLFEVKLPQVSGFQEVAVNLGELRNKGLDISLSSVNIDSENFKWTSDLTFSRTRDKLVSLLGADNNGDGIEDDIVANSLFIGKPIETIFDYQVTGELWQLGDDIPSGFGVGTYRLRDMDGIQGISPDDRTILGYLAPDYAFSFHNQFEYKNWSLNVFINSVQGGKDRYLGRDNLWSWNAPNKINLFDNSYNLPRGIDYWTPENPDARYPKIGNITSFPASRYVSRSFVRLQDVSLGYRFKEGLLQELNLSSLRIYLSGKNLCTWTDYTGWDPETGTGITMSGSPVMKSVTLGVNFEF